MGLIGAHMSIAGGVDKAIDRGEALGCEAIQIFTSSSRTWTVKPIDEEIVKAFRKKLKDSSVVQKAIAHNSYLLNLSTNNAEVRKKSVDFFLKIMDQCEALGIESLVTHPGSHVGAGVEAGIQATVQSLNEVLAATAGYQTKIVIENTAGQGACIGHEFQQLKEIVDSVTNPERIFFCFDTQHAFAAGYDLRQPDNYEEVFEHFNEVIGLKKIVAFHLNDAIKGLNSRVDRHENIGKGELGKTPFQLLVNDKRFKNTPMCLETFPGDDDENYRREIKLLKNFRK